MTGAHTVEQSVYVKAWKMVDFHATFALVEDLFGFQLGELARAFLLQTDLTRSGRGQDRSDALFGQAALFHFADAAELRHVLAMHALGAVVAAAGLALFTTRTTGKWCAGHERAGSYRTRLCRSLAVLLLSAG